MYCPYQTRTETDCFGITKVRFGDCHYALCPSYAGKGRCLLVEAGTAPKREPNVNVVTAKKGKARSSM